MDLAIAVPSGINLQPESDPDKPIALPIVAIPPPPPAIRDRVARLIIEIVARRALADLGLVAKVDNSENPPG